MGRFVIMGGPGWGKSSIGATFARIMAIDADDREAVTEQT